jgi:hypothetical protein
MAPEILLNDTILEDSERNEQERPIHSSSSDKGLNSLTKLSKIILPKFGLKLSELISETEFYKKFRA